MEVYLLTLFLIFVFGILDFILDLSNTQRNSFIFIIYVIIVLQIGLRWETGTDWKPYLTNFEQTEDYSIVILNSLTGFEIGYGTFVFLTKLFFNDYSYFLVIHSFVFYLLIFKSFKNYSPYFFISLLFFYSTTLGLIGSNRQLLAVGICLIALSFILKNKPIKFFIAIAIASLFHTSAFLFGIYYFLNRSFKPITIFLVLISSFIIGKTSFPLLFFSKLGSVFGTLAASKVIDYTNIASDSLLESSLSIFGLIRRLSFIAVFTYSYSILNQKLNYYKVLYNGYIFGMIMYFLFSNSLLILVNRGALYFNIMESLLLSCQFLLFNKRTEKIYLYFGLLIISILLLFQSISAYPDLFTPYKSLFYNVDFTREMY
jgi:hypothetical protein